MCIIHLECIDKFTWALDRDIVCIVTKISLQTAFLQYFTNIMVLKPSKNMKFFVKSFYTHSSQYPSLNTHKRPHSSLTNCKLLRLWLEIFLFVNHQIHHSALYAHFWVSCCVMQWPLDKTEYYIGHSLLIFVISLLYVLVATNQWQ